MGWWLAGKQQGLTVQAELGHHRAACWGKVSMTTTTTQCSHWCQTVAHCKAHTLA